MFTLFTVRHVGGGPPTWRRHTKLYNFVRNISTNISTLGQHAHLKRGDLSSLFIVYNYHHTTFCYHFVNNVQNTFSFGSALDERTRNKLYGVISVEFIYLTARVARQWIKERGIIDMHVRAKSGSVFCRNTNTFYNTFYTTMRNNELSYDSDQIRLCRRVHQ